MNLLHLKFLAVFVLFSLTICEIYDNAESDLDLTVFRKTNKGCRR